MKIGILLTLSTVLLTSAVAWAQVQIINTNIGPLNVGDKFYYKLDGNCSITGTTTNTTPAVATISPATFTNFAPAFTPPDASNSFTIAALSPGSTEIVANFTETTCVEGLPGGAIVKLTIGVTVVGNSTPPTPPPTSGNTLETGSAGEPVSTASGELYGHDEVADLSLGGPTGLEFRRYYGSFLTANSVKSALGTNWMSNFDVSLGVNGAVATVTLFRGKTVVFKQVNGSWTLSSNEQRPYQLAAAGGGYQFVDPRSNLIYAFSAGGALASIEDRNGNSITVTQGANGSTLVSDGLGRTLTFTYTGSNLTQVQDQSGRNVSFQYSNGSLSAWTNANGNKATFTYTSSGSRTGLMSTETRPAGNVPLTQSFDSSGRVATQTDSFSNTLTLTYSGNSPGATLTEPGGFSVTHVEDPNMNLISQSDPSGGASTYTYDSDNRPITATDRLGNVTKATWDPASGLLASQTDELGNTTSYTYAALTIGPFTFYDLSGIHFPDGTVVTLKRDSMGNLTSATDQAGNVTQLTYTSNGWPATRTNPSGGVYTYSYNGDGTPVSAQLPSGDTTAFGWDSAKRLNLITNPDSTAESLLHDGLSNITKATDERSNSVAASFDVNNNAKTTTDALSYTSKFAFDTDDRLTSATDPVGNVTTQAWDGQSRLSAVTNAAGNKRIWTYDNLNRVTAVKDASGNGFNFTLDGENRATAVTDALSRTVGYTRDPHGNITGKSTPKSEKFSYSFDALNRLTSATDPLGRNRQYTWDPRGIISAIVLPGGVGTEFNLNALGLATSVTDPVGNVWNRAFDNMGRMVSKTDPLGRITSFSYDSRQRLSSAVLPVGSGGAAQYSYDAVGNLTTLKYSDGTSLNYAWDADNRLTAASGFALGYDADGRITSSNGLTITRDPAGRIASVTYAPGKTVNYAYNNRGLVSQITDWVGGNTTFAYDAAAQLSTLAYANGVTQAYTWDADGRLLTLNVTKGGAALSSIGLTRDGLGRVTNAARSTGNIPAEATGSLQLAYDGAAQVLGDTFDGLGRLTADALRSYTWDLASRMTSYSGSDGAATFTYDARGQRLTRTSGGTTQNYVWNYAFPWPCVSIVQSGGADQTYYVWLPNGTLLNSISTADNTRRFYHFDESGSAVLLTDGAGTVTDTYATSIYGDTVTQTGSTANPFTWQGKFGIMREGSTSMYYMRARYYDSGPLRFLSRDPLASRDPREINPYQFARENPLERMDATGMGDGDASPPANPQPASSPSGDSTAFEPYFDFSNLLGSPPSDYVSQLPYFTAGEADFVLGYSNQPYPSPFINNGFVDYSTPTWSKVSVSSSAPVQTMLLWNGPLWNVPHSRPVPAPPQAPAPYTGGPGPVFNGVFYVLDLDPLPLTVYSTLGGRLVCAANLVWVSSRTSLACSVDMFTRKETLFTHIRRVSTRLFILM